MKADVEVPAYDFTAALNCVLLHIVDYWVSIVAH